MLALITKARELQLGLALPNDVQLKATQSGQNV